MINKMIITSINICGFDPARAYPSAFPTITSSIKRQSNHHSRCVGAGGTLRVVEAERYMDV